MSGKLQELEEALRFVIRVVDQLEAEKTPLRIELLFMRARAKRVLGLSQVEGES